MVVDVSMRSQPDDNAVDVHRHAHAAPPGRWADVGWRIGLVVAASICLALAPPAWLAFPLAIGTAGVAVERVVRHRGRGLLDAVLVGSGGWIVALGLLGFVLNLLPGGVSRTGWAFGGGVLLVIALAWCRRKPVPRSPLVRLEPLLSLATAGYALVVAGIVAAALLLAVRSTDQVQIPPLQMSASTVGTQSEISISSGTEVGPLDLIMHTQAGDVLAAGSITVGPGRAVSVTVTPPAGQSTTIQLIHPGQTVPLREVIVETEAPTGGS
jgi:hypothetical protein